METIDKRVKSIGESMTDKLWSVVLLMEIRYRDACRSFLPANHQWWRRDTRGNVVQGWQEGGYQQLDFSCSDYREHVALRAQAAVASGVVDGIMLPDGAMKRDYEKGAVVYNPMGNQTVTITFDEPRSSRATGKCARIHTLAPCDGDMFLKEGF